MSMKEFKFRLYKEETLIIPATSEEDAWVEISKLNPDLLGLQWSIDLVETPLTKSQALADSAEPVPDEHDPLFDGDFDDYSYLNPSLPRSLG